jgi:uncharacterized protein (DUF2147 family)
MGRILRSGILAALLLAPASARASDPTGIWWADGGAAKVEIEHCGDALCGNVVWLRSPFDPNGCPLRDDHNPDPALRERDVLGLRMLAGLRRSDSDPREWLDGEIYDPGAGRNYSATLRMDGPDRLKLRGYLGFRILGRTTNWIRVRDELQCNESA